MIRLEDVTVRVGPAVVLEDASWHLREGSHVGIVGRNGAGKTTLLRVLAGELEVESGTIHRRGGSSLAWLHQQSVTVGERSLWEEVRSGMTRHHALRRTLEKAEAAVAAGEQGASEQLDRALEAFRIAEGFSVDERVGGVLHGLGFAPSDRDRPCSDFSGGWRMRIALARHLLADASVRLLDEPTNHLDLPARTWLGSHLAASPDTIVVVSHDRWLLDAVARETVEIRRGALSAFSGSPSRWAQERAQRDAHAVAEAKRIDAKAAKLERFVERFGAKATKAAASRSAEKKLARIEAERPDAPVAEEAVARLSLPAAPPSSDVLVSLSDASFGHEGGPSWSGVSIEVLRGQRWAVVGPNGAGKSTLLGALMGEIGLAAGQRRLGRDVRPAIHRQDLAAHLPPDQTALEHVREHGPPVSDTRLRGVLGALDLPGERALQPIGTLSGGQKARVVLARFVLEPANLLLLDEPTNHLDGPTAEALADALAAWDGGLVVVSHDRWLVERVATHLCVVREGHVETFQRVDAAALDAAAAPARRVDETSPQDDDSAPTDAEATRAARKANQRSQRRLDRLHEELDRLEGRLSEIDEALFAQAADPDAARRLGEERAAAEAALETTFEEAAALEEEIAG